MFTGLLTLVASLVGGLLDGVTAPVLNLLGSLLHNLPI
jgi:uncharacterized membrane protein